MRRHGRRRLDLSGLARRPGAERLLQLLRDGVERLLVGADALAGEVELLQPLGLLCLELVGLRLGRRQTQFRGARGRAHALAGAVDDARGQADLPHERQSQEQLAQGAQLEAGAVDHLVERFRGQREQIRAALQYLKQRDPDRWSKSADKLLPFYDDLFAQPAAQKGAH